MDKARRGNEDEQQREEWNMRRRRMGRDRRGNEDKQQSLVSAQMFCADQLVTNESRCGTSVLLMTLLRNLENQQHEKTGTIN